MTSRDFCFWLQGAFEVAPGGAHLTPDQVEVIKKHLALVFVHEIDPSMGDAKIQEALNAVHEGKPNLQPAQARPDGPTVYRC